MDAPNKIYVEVCEDGIFAFPKPPFYESVEYIRADFVEQPLQQERPGLPGVEGSGVPGKDYIPVEWVDACEKYGKWKIVKQDQPEVDLENYISNKLRELGADLINNKPYSFNRGLNVGKTNAYHDILDRLNARKEK